MDLKWLVPGKGDHQTLQRLRELEQKAGTLPVMFALFFTKAIEITVLAIPPVFITLPKFIAPLFDAIKMLVAAIIVGIIHVYELDLTSDDEQEFESDAGIE